MKARIIIVMLFCAGANCFGQTDVKNYTPVGLFNKSYTAINGFSVGLWAGIDDDQVNTTTNGIRLELIGMGLILPLAPRSPIGIGADLTNGTNQFTEKINGVNLSGSGTVCGGCLINGISIGAIGQYVYSNNGISLSLLITLIQEQNGLQLAVFNESDEINGAQIGFSNESKTANGLQIGLMTNHAKKTRGIQIGAYNSSKDLEGIQLGLWNVNQKRKLPLINWNFRK